MRIVGGELSGRRFGGRVHQATRPTSERVREALASALDARGLLRDARVLDLYAGTGALGFEALSRGAREACFVEADAHALRALRASLHQLGLDERAHALRLTLSPKTLPSLARQTGGEGFDLVFADPPYAELESALSVLAALPTAGLLSPGAHLVLEQAARDPVDLPERLASVARYRYGDTRVSLLEWPTSA
ncbi:MAG: methyltransferase [Deltaproteobacteria bacterium]|nr:methyltransferase [Deltaproteobacteria bacterium]